MDEREGYFLFMMVWAIIVWVFAYCVLHYTLGPVFWISYILITITSRLLKSKD